MSYINYIIYECFGKIKILVLVDFSVLFKNLNAKMLVSIFQYHSLFQSILSINTFISTFTFYLCCVHLIFFCIITTTTTIVSIIFSFTAAAAAMCGLLVARSDDAFPPNNIVVFLLVCHLKLPITISWNYF